MIIARIIIRHDSNVEVDPNPIHDFDPHSRLLPLDLIASELNISEEVLRQAAAKSLFRTTVDASGLRVAKLSDVATALRSAEVENE